MCCSIKVLVRIVRKIMKSNRVAVGGYIQRLRETRGMTVTQLAAALETTEGQIRNIEKGRVDTRSSMLINLCDYLQGSLDDIAQLMLSETATPEYGAKIAERWIAQRGQQPPGKRAAESRAPYVVNGQNASVN
jgi:transcriptional regulator with XRE-family HTH domain